MSRDVQAFAQLSVFDRVDLTLQHAKEQGELWILKDDDGCVMLTADDEDGVPIWPTELLAKQWATDEWSHCVPTVISLDVWKQRWLPGLENDDLVVVVCPLPGEKGESLTVQEIAEKLG